MIAIPIFCVMLAAFFKAVADTLSHHYDTSVFKRLDRYWWDPAISWKHVKLVRFTKYRPDAWHLANSGNIVAWCAAIAFARYLPYAWWVIIGGAGLLFIITFNTFYNKILRK